MVHIHIHPNGREDDGERMSISTDSVPHWLVFAVWVMFILLQVVIFAWFIVSIIREVKRI